MAAKSSRNDAAKTLIDRVTALGYPRNYVEAQVPRWWSAEANRSASAVLQLELTIARRLGLDMRALLEGKTTLARRLKAKYKRGRRYTEQDVALSMGVCSALAESIAASIQTPYRAVPQDPSEIRTFLRKQGAKRLSLSALVMYCWYLGIPVVHASNLPTGKPKMDGLVLWAEERPVVVLAKQSQYQAWLLFILAHELGHIARGHLRKGEVIIDEDFEGDESKDAEEAEADAFALELLNGEASPSYNLDLSQPRISLAREALALGNKLEVDPGHILLVEARRTNRWQEANAALAEYQERTDDARARINTALVEHIKSEGFDLHGTSAGEELEEHLSVVTGKPVEL